MKLKTEPIILKFLHLPFVIPATVLDTIAEVKFPCPKVCTATVIAEVFSRRFFFRSWYLSAFFGKIISSKVSSSANILKLVVER